MATEARCAPSVADVMRFAEALSDHGRAACVVAAVAAAHAIVEVDGVAAVHLVRAVGAAREWLAGRGARPEAALGASEARAAQLHGLEDRLRLEVLGAAERLWRLPTWPDPVRGSVGRGFDWAAGSILLATELVGASVLPAVEEAVLLWALEGRLP